MAALAFGDLMLLRNELWSEIRRLPGVITIGIGSKNDRTALVVFVDEEKVQKGDLPVQYADVQVVVEPARIAKAQRG